MIENFTLLQTFFNGIDAHSTKNHLESHGIFCQIIGDINATNYNVFTPTNGGIRLFVHQDDYEKALKVLA